MIAAGKAERFSPKPSFLVSPHQGRCIETVLSPYKWAGPTSQSESMKDSAVIPVMGKNSLRSIYFQPPAWVKSPL
jgi:hypothetical protein